MINDEKRDIRQQVADFYDQNCQTFSQTRSCWWSDLNFIKKYLKKKGQILDFGCGNGRLVDLLVKEKSDLEYQGVDISKYLIDIARKKYPNQKFIVLQNQEKISFENESFDLIMAIAVFHHLSPEMAEKNLKELNRILKKEGKLILTVWYLWSWRYLKFWLKDFSLGKSFFSGKIPFGQKKQKRWCYWWTLGKLEKSLKTGGFKIKEKGITFSQNKQKRNYFLVGEK